MADEFIGLATDFSDPDYLLPTSSGKVRWEHWLLLEKVRLETGPRAYCLEVVRPSQVTSHLTERERSSIPENYLALAYKNTTYGQNSN